MAKQKMLEDLFPETLKDIYYAERQIVNEYISRFEIRTPGMEQRCFPTRFEERGACRAGRQEAS